MNLITSIPFAITNPGAWRPAHSFDAYNLPFDPVLGRQIPAITLACDDVVLDGNGMRFINSAGFGNRGVSIYGKNRSRCVVQNFILQGAGAMYQILLENTDLYTSVGHNVVCNNLILSSNFRGIRTEGNNTAVVRNTIRSIGGATSLGLDVYAEGIEHWGPRGIIADNIIEDVYGTLPQGESVGISMSHECDDSIVRNNIIRNKTKTTKSIGIWTGDPQYNVLVLDNVVENMKRSLWGSTYTGVADGNRDFNCGALPGEAAHPIYDVVTPGWTGSNIGT